MQACCYPWWYQAPSWDGDTLVDHTSCCYTYTRSSILTRYFGILTGRPDTVVFWYFGHVFWYFGAARHENGLFLRQRLHLGGATTGGLHDLRGGVWPIPGNWFLIYSNRFFSPCLGKFKWLWCTLRRLTTIVAVEGIQFGGGKVDCNCNKTALFGWLLWIGGCSALYFLGQLHSVSASCCWIEKVKGLGWEST